MWLHGAACFGVLASEGEWDHGLCDPVATEFTPGELFVKLNNDEFYEFLYDFVMLISHSTKERREMCNLRGDGVMTQVSSSDLTWGVVKYIDNERKWGHHVSEDSRERIRMH